MIEQDVKQGFHLLSFDIEEWFLGRDALKIPVEKWNSLTVRVIDNTKIILNLLQKNNQKAIFYVMGWIVEQYPDLVKLIVDEGHTIGYHSYYHQLPEQQHATAFEEELVLGLSMLEKVSGQKIIHYRAPQFSLNANSLWIIPVLVKNGIEISSSTASGDVIRNLKIPPNPFCFNINNNKLIELPLKRVRFFGKHFVFSGSGYTRITPWFAQRYFYGKSKYTITYFHPRDFDVHVPKSKELGFARNLLNRIGNKTTYNKLESLLSNFEFLSPDQLRLQLIKQDQENKLPLFSFNV